MTGQPDNIVLSQEPKKAVLEMIQIISNLSSTMQKETKAVLDNDQKAFIALQDEKVLAASHYKDGVSQLIARKEEMRKVPQSLKDQLEALRSEFLEIAKDNLRALERMRNGMQRLSDRIMSAAKKEAENAQKFVYGAHGKLEGSGKASIGVNESA